MYTYTADGTRLVAEDPTTTTLYLPGTEIKRTKSTGAITENRYYSYAGQTCAMKTPGWQVTWLVSDHQGTQSISIGASIITRRQLPYGGARGSGVTWPNSKGFVGGDNDPTGLTYVGARAYDASVGRFISADPVPLTGCQGSSESPHWWSPNIPTFSRLSS